MPSELGYYRHPTIHGDSIVFASEDDLWCVSDRGGQARRLTASPGTVTFPVCSPDGAWIAFTGRDDGPAEVYLMGADGGVPRRLTWLGSMTQVVGWRPDSQAVILASDWRQPFLGYFHLHAAPADGGPVKPLPVGPARAISFGGRGGRGVVIGRNSGDPARWKRYRGGTAGTIWIDRTGDGSFNQLLRVRGNLANPMWIGSRIYFLADHEGFGNLYSTTTTGRDLRRHTHHEDFYVRFPSTDGRRIVYQAGGDIHLFDPASERSHRLEIRTGSPRSQRARKFVSAQRYHESHALHPAGHSIAVVSRGGVYAMGLWEGAQRRYGETSGVRYRLAAWLPDGKRMVAVTDEGGEESLAVMSLVDEGREPQTAIRRLSGDFGRPIDLAVAPFGPDRVALTNQRQEVILVDLQSGKSVTVERSEHDRIDGLAWSPDGRWLAYGFPESRRNTSIHLCDVIAGKIIPITRPDFRDVRPAFDPEGKYLYFLSWRVFDPVYDSLYFDLGFPRGSRPHLMTLRRDVVSPFSDATREPRAPGPPVPPVPPTNHVNPGNPGNPAARPGSKANGEESAEPPEVTIDIENIENRVVAIPVPEGRYGRILGGQGRVLFSSFPIEGSLDQTWFDAGEPDAKGQLSAYDFAQNKTENVVDGITDFEVSMDGKVLAVRVGNRIRVLPIAYKAEGRREKPEPGRESGWLDLDRLRVSVIPTEEWKQMFREAWRLQRDQFWTQDMSGHDWREIHDRYLPLVERVASRSEFSDLLWEMQGELGTSHCYELGGDYRPEPRWFQGALGADLEFDSRTGTWRIARIPRGDSWNEQAFCPLAAPGLDIREGDEILAINGEPVDRTVSPDERLVHLAGQNVQVTVRSSGRRSPARRAAGRAASPAARGPKAGEVRTVTVKTLASETGLRYRAWVEGNRERVHRETQERVGYIHVPDMGPRGYAEFHRYFMTEVDREGLVIDVRWNGGGHVSQLVLEKLVRQRIGYGTNRWGRPESYPSDAPMGPMVAITNEYAGSDGDIFSHCFKLLGLGPLVGKRTWGGVVGIWPRHALVDGTVTTQPEFAFWFRDVGWGVENYGTDPDIEVEIRPQDHAVGADPQVDRALVEIMRQIRQKRPVVPRFDNRPKLRPERLPRIP